VKRGALVLACVCVAAAGASVVASCRAKEVPSASSVNPAPQAAAHSAARPTPYPTSGPSAKRYPFRGVVTAVDPARSRITVTNEEIPNVMPAMTMSLAVRDDPRVIGLLRPGDRIEATIVMDTGGDFLEQILTKGFVPTPAAK
jgi:Cu/Ag efflux protein CusF